MANCARIQEYWSDGGAISKGQPIPEQASAFYCGGAGDAQVTLRSGQSVFLKGLLAGRIYRLALERVEDVQATTASDLLWLA